jgi:DNA-binding transcriptional ArsR family regulator
MTYGPAGHWAAPQTISVCADSRVLVSTGVEAADGFAALADPVRLAIVRVLAAGERCVCDVQEQVAVAGNLLSYHLRILREAGLVAATRRGRWVDYRLDGDGFAELWAAAAHAGVPLPGEQLATARAGASCERRT